MYQLFVKTQIVSFFTFVGKILKYRCIVHLITDSVLFLNLIINESSFSEHWKNMTFKLFPN